MTGTQAAGASHRGNGCSSSKMDGTFRSINSLRPAARWCGRRLIAETGNRQARDMRRVVGTHLTLRLRTPAMQGSGRDVPGTSSKEPSRTRRCEPE